MHVRPLAEDIEGKDISLPSVNAIILKIAKPKPIVHLLPLPLSGEREIIIPPSDAVHLVGVCASHDAEPKSDQDL
jgi:hypothetical protein